MSDFGPYFMECKHVFVTSFPRYLECVHCGKGVFTNDTPVPVLAQGTGNG